MWVRTALVDEELAETVKELVKLPGRRLFRHELGGEVYNLTARRLNEYIRTYLGEEFTGKDFRTWGGTLLAAISLAERGSAETDADAKCGRGGDEEGRRETRKYAGRCPVVVRKPRCDRAVSRRSHPGRFSSPPATRGARA
jgi:DNA topoisomerase-1